MKVIFIYPMSVEFAYPNYRNKDPDKFDIEIICKSDDFVTKFPRAVQEFGVEPIFFYLSQKGKTKKEFMHKYGFRLRRIPVRFGAGHLENEISLTLLKQLSREKFDLLHFYSYYRHWRYPDMFDIFAFYCRLMGYRFVGHYQADEFPGTHTKTFFKKLLFKPKRFIKKIAINGAERIFTISKLELERLTNPNHPQYYGIPFKKDKFVYLPNIVDTSLFFPVDRYEACRQLNKDYCKKYILYVGFFREAKGIQHLINIMPRVIREYSNVELVLVGSGEYEEKLRELVIRLGIEDKVLFVGHVSNDSLYPYYNMGDVHVLPSYTEGFASVLIESLACNTPSVATNVGGIPDVLSDGVGLLIPPKNEDELFDAIKKVLDGDFKIDSKKRQRKLNEYSYKNAGKILFETYKKILEDK